MCGLAALAGDFDDALLQRMIDSMRHRGPDGSGTIAEGGAGLASCRLAILDLEGGEQPMESVGGDTVIAFNGEIFNAPELRARLDREGVRFRTDHSDTEVVLALYERDGEDCVRSLNGMFAFLILDRKRGRLFGARDRFGIKPLYLARPNGGLAVASELKTLLQVPGIDRELDRESLFHFVSLRFVPGERSILRGVQRLPPAHRFTYDLDTRDLRVDRWWQLRFRPERGLSREAWRGRLREELRAATVRWTLADVPIACSLSGGLDSSAITALLAEAGHPHLRTYTLAFAGDDGELALARALAERWGTQHHEHRVEPDELLDDLLSMVWALDEPYGGGLPSWYVFRFMAEDVKVGLTGTGGDELFGNYRRFVPFESGRLARLRRRAVRRYHFEPSYYATDAEKRELGLDGPDTADLLQAVWDESGSESPRDSVLYTDVSTQLANEFLHMTDRFSMAHSLEGRTPFLDHELVELVASIPPELRTTRDDPKGLLRDAVADLLTPAHLEAPKRTFVFPLARWLREELRPLAEHLLADERLRAQGLFRPALRERYLEPHLRGERDTSELLWPLLMFQLWHLLYVEEQLDAPPTFGWRDVVSSAVAR